MNIKEFPTEELERLLRVNELDSNPSSEDYLWAQATLLYLGEKYFRETGLPGRVYDKRREYQNRILNSLASLE
jgi:hypothetical protein